MEMGIRFGDSLKTLGLFTALVLALGGLFPENASAGQHVGWCWADEPNSTLEYDCDGFDSVTHAGAGVKPLGTGAFEVVFSHLYAEGWPSTVQVSADLTSGYCTTSGWTNGVRKSAEIFVNCYDAAGNPQNNYFSVLYQSRTQPFGNSGKGIAYLLADQPSAESYAPNPAYQYNSAGTVNSMTRSGTGVYSATIPGLTKKGGNVQVTAYGPNPARCKTSGWSSDEAGTSVNVLCFDASGAPADEMFTLLYTLHEAAAPLKQLKGASAWADKASKTKPYTPASA